MKNGLSFVYNFYRYGKNYKVMLYESKKAQLIQHKNVTKEIMSVVLWPTFKKLGEREYPKINFRKKMYVKKEYPDITLENIQNLLKLMGNKSIDVSNIKQEVIYKNETDIINNKEISKDELYRDKVPKNIKKYFVSTTLLHSSYITFPEEKKTLKYSIMNSFFEYNKPNETKDALMIFIHGGGFVGMSTQFHESFLREWVNELKIPFIGINYGLSPMHKYPYGLNDCYQAYRWIVNHCEDIIGIKPKKLILSGDSSGATFVLSLTFLLIAKNEFENANIRLPDLILPLYPCCNTSYKNMSLSLIITVKDFLLNDKFLLYVNDAYRDTYPNDDDPFLNPAQAKECILKKLPKSVWHFGNCDPLRDDIVRLLAKISKIKEVDIKAYEFKEYNHGWNGGVKNEFIVKVPRNMVFKEIRDMIN
jgi:hormone-sensitive lipase